MAKYKNKSEKLWYGYRKDAANHFNVAEVTIDAWFDKNEHKLMRWLEEGIERREKEKVEALQIKEKIITASIT